MWTKRPSEIAEFASQYGNKDSGYGVYFGVCKRKSSGSGKKSDVLGSTALWVDIDATVNGVKPEAIIDAIGKMPANIQPSIVVHSGGGVHCYWMLDEPCGDIEAIEDTNKVLMQLMGGDACFDVTRVLRLPDTYNNKRTTKKLCRVVYCADHLRYSIDDLMKGVIAWKKVLHGGSWVSPKEAQNTLNLNEDDAPHWFEKIIGPNGRRLEGKLSDLWYDRVREHAPRGYIGVHEATIVTAARLMCAGYEVDKIVEKTINYQKSAPGVDTSGWDWDAEERKIRQCIETWGDKWRVLKKRKKPDGKPGEVSPNNRVVPAHLKGKRQGAVPRERRPVSLRERRVVGGRG